MKRIIILRGPAGVGKSTISKLLKKSLESSQLFNLDIVCHDMLGSHPKEKEVRYKAHEVCLEAVKRIKKDNIIFERLFLFQDDIDHLKKTFSNFKYNFFVITLKASEKKLIKQDSKRIGNLGPDNIKRLNYHFNKSNIKKSDLEIEIRNKGPKRIVSEIISYLNSKK